MGQEYGNSRFKNMANEKQRYNMETIKEKMKKHKEITKPTGKKFCAERTRREITGK